jgi:hypothetical protein
MVSFVLPVTRAGVARSRLRVFNDFSLHEPVLAG